MRLATGRGGLYLPPPLSAADIMIGILGKKLGMTQIFQPDGTCVPVTVVEAGPCKVLQVKVTDPSELPEELELMGDVAIPEDELSPNGTEPRELMGRVAIDTRTFMGTPVFEEPADETGHDDDAGDDGKE